MLGLKFNYVSKRGHRTLDNCDDFVFCLWIQCSSMGCRFLWTSESPRFSTSNFFVIRNVSYLAEGQCPFAQCCDSLSYANNTSAHFSISFRHPWALSASILIEVCPAHVHNPAYILEWAFSFWGMVEVLWTSWGVWPWYFPVIEILEGLRNIWRRRYGVPIFHSSVPVCKLGESWPWLCVHTGGEICIMSPDFNKLVKPMSEPIWHNFIIFAICYLKVLHS